MLMFDLAGRLIEPTRLKKTIGGDIDRDGLPAKIDVPTTGDFADVTVSDLSTDGAMGKTLSRSTLGKMRVTNTQANQVKGFVEALRMQAFVMGGGSQSATGQTSRSFRYGFWHPSVYNEGAWVEYLPPANGTTTGMFLTVRHGGTITRTPINLQVNNPAEHYPLDLWISRNPKTGGWTVTIMEGGQPRTEMTFPLAQLDLDERYLVPFVEWERLDATGSCTATICQFSHTVYWRF